MSLESNHNSKNINNSGDDGKYYQLFNNMINAVVFFDIVKENNGQPIDFHIHEINTAFERLTGLKERQVINKTLTEVFPDLNLGIITDDIELILKGDNISKDLYFRPLEKHLHIVVYSPQEGSYAAIINDISKRKIAEEALKESENRYKLIAENTSDIIWVMDKNMKNTYVSPSTLRFRGYTVNEHLGQKHEEILTIESFKYVKKKLREALVNFSDKKKADPIVLEVEYQHKDGSIIWAEVNVNFIFSRDGSVFGFHGVSRNIEDRKKIEIALIESEKRFKSLLMALPDVMLIISSEGRYLDVFTSKPELLSTSPKQLLKTSISERLPQKFALQALSVIKKVIETNKMGDFEYPVKLKSGTKWFQANVAPYDSQNGKHVLWLARDITNRKESESDLINAKQKAIESDNLKSNFLANMSHEIRTPMNGILGFTSLLKEEGLSQSERNEYIKMIDNSAEILLKLIDDIIDISKIEAKQIKIEASEYKINPLLEDMLTLFEEIKSSKHKDHISLRLTVPVDSSDKKIVTDSMRLTQVFTNLLGNALKFTDEGFIEFGYIVNDQNGFEFFVRDTGIGIPESKQKIIFERFRQADDTSTRLFGGTGLGLAISKGLISMLGGSIRIVSKPGEGSTFFFTLPKKTSSNLQTEFLRSTSEQKTYSWQGKKILITEDNEISFRLIEVILKKTKVNILHAKNGYEAIDFITKEPDIDLVLMDIHLPEMDGFEATKRIKKINKKIPVIAQTAYAMKEEKDKCYESGCEQIITKPINSNILLSTLNKFLSPL